MYVPEHLEAFDLLEALPPVHQATRAGRVQLATKQVRQGGANTFFVLTNASAHLRFLPPMPVQ